MIFKAQARYKRIVQYIFASYNVKKGYVEYEVRYHTYIVCNIIY